MSKKIIKKVAIIIFLIVILFTIIVGIIYYYINRKYTGEYSIQFTTNYSYSDFNISENTTGIFKIQEIATYSEYLEYCNEWGLEIDYSNEECNYIILGGMIYDSFELTNIIYFKNNVIIFCGDSSRGTDSSSMFKVLIIPTTDIINNINIQYIDININLLTEILKYLLIILLIVIFLVICIMILTIYRDLYMKKNQEKIER